MKASPETLRKAVVKRVAECRAGLKKGHADLAGLQEGVRAYCEAVAKLPRAQARTHAGDLESLMQEINELSRELERARDDIGREIAGLSRLKQANVAYNKSDAMGPVYRRKREDD